MLGLMAMAFAVLGTTGRSVSCARNSTSSIVTLASVNSVEMSRCEVWQ